MSEITLVVGAGASKEVNMPTGFELLQTIQVMLDVKLDRVVGLYGGDDKFRDALMGLYQRYRDHSIAASYIHAAQHISSAMPQAVSIDNFIDSHKSNNAIAEVAKVAIALSILEAERKSSIFVANDNSPTTIDFKENQLTWFNKFFQHLCVNTQHHELPEKLKKITIVTFNYDRTIEHFLFYSLKNFYKLSDEAAAEILSHLNIFHPYGVLGSLPCMRGGMKVNFGEDPFSSTLIEISKQIKTFTESEGESSEDVGTLRSLIRNSKKIVFLGFAYHKLNLKLLFGDGYSREISANTQVYGSAYGISQPNVDVIRREIILLNGMQHDRLYIRNDLKASELLTEFERSIAF